MPSSKPTDTNRLSVIRPDIAAEWHPTLNGDVMPGDVAMASSKKAWWRCSVNPEHVYETVISYRTSGGTGCQSCKSLAFRYPEIAKEWHPTLNEGVMPEDVAAGSGRKYYWQCPADPEHVYDALVNSRTSGNGCPYCSGNRVSKTNSLAARFPDIAKQWHPTKNKGVMPEDVTAGSDKKYYWQCPVDPEHVWEAAVNSRTSRGDSRTSRGDGCPYCSGNRVSKTNSLAARFPAIAAEWHPTLNGGLTPEDVTAGTNKKCKWQCPADPEHVYDARVVDRTGLNSGCPHCSGHANHWTEDRFREFVRSLGPSLLTMTEAQLWQVLKNGEISSAGSRSKAGSILKGLRGGKLSRKDIKNYGETGTVPPNIDIDGPEDGPGDIWPPMPPQDPDQPDEPTDGHTDGPTDTDPGPLPGSGGAKEILRNTKVAVDKTDADAELAEFFISESAQQLWQVVLGPDEKAEVEAIRAATDPGLYHTETRKRFLLEYDTASGLRTPRGYRFSSRHTGSPITPPSLMQKLTAVLVRDRHRILNASMTGTGKTNAAILASRVSKSKLTVVICPNNTVDGWEASIKAMFPDSVVATKTFDLSGLPKKAPRFAVFNYETFQQAGSREDGLDFVKKYRPDFFVIDEVHFVKQRNDISSIRRSVVKEMVDLAAEQRPDLRVLGMSATPVINNLREAVALMELITGQDVEINGKPFDSRDSVDNAMELYKKRVLLGPRMRSSYAVKLKETSIKVEIGSDDFQRLLAAHDSRSILNFESVLTEVKIPAILASIKPKERVIIYSHYIGGAGSRIDQKLVDALTKAGHSVGLFTGTDKEGKSAFRDGKINVLVASNAISTGIDGLQDDCAKLIINSLPWTSAEYEQLKGRIYRQGQTRDVEIVIPVTYSAEGPRHPRTGEPWSYCAAKMDRIRIKRDLALAVVDGVPPADGVVLSPTKVHDSYTKWMDRLTTVKKAG